MKLPSVTNSCGAALKGSPGRQPWVAVIGNRRRGAAKGNSLWPKFGRPWRGFGGWRNFRPRLTPWATVFRHTVADSLRGCCQNLICANLMCAEEGSVLICFRWLRRCRGAQRCLRTASTRLGRYREERTVELCAGRDNYLAQRPE